MLMKKIGIGFVLCFCLVGCKKKQQTQNNEAVKKSVPQIVTLNPPTGLSSSFGTLPWLICAMTPVTLLPLPACSVQNTITPCSVSSNQIMVTGGSTTRKPDQVQFGIVINNVCTVVDQNGPVASGKSKIK